MGRLITPSLLDSIDWFRKSPPDWKQRAYEGLKNTVTRAPWNPTPAIERGIAFERMVCSCLDMDEEKFMSQFKAHTPDVVKFHQRCKGGALQKVLKKDITIDDVVYTLYGRSDVYFESLIVDIKTTQRFKGQKSYTDKAQAYVYAHCSGIPAFLYLVASFDDDSLICTGVHEVPMTIDLDVAERVVRDRIKDCITLLQDDKELWQAYTKTFNRYN